MPFLNRYFAAGFIGLLLLRIIREHRARVLERFSFPLMVTLAFAAGSSLSFVNSSNIQASIVEWLQWMMYYAVLYITAVLVRDTNAFWRLLRAALGGVLVLSVLSITNLTFSGLLLDEYFVVLKTDNYVGFLGAMALVGILTYLVRIRWSLGTWRQLLLCGLGVFPVIQATLGGVRAAFVIVTGVMFLLTDRETWLKTGVAVAAVLLLGLTVDGSLWNFYNDLLKISGRWLSKVSTSVFESGVAVAQERSLGPLPGTPGEAVVATSGPQQLEHDGEANPEETTVIRAPAVEGETAAESSTPVVEAAGTAVNASGDADSPPMVAVARPSRARRLNLSSLLAGRGNFSNMERIRLWTGSLEMFAEQPLVGWGIGTWRFRYYSGDYTRSANQYPHAHSTVAQMLAEVGLLGWLPLALTYLGSIFTAWVTSRRARGDSAARLPVLISLGLTLSALAGAFINNYVFNAVPGIAVFLLLGLGYASPRLLSSHAEEVQR